jgi:hypothetical protein
MAVHRKRNERTPKPGPSPRGWRSGGSNFVVVSQQDGYVPYAISEDDVVGEDTPHNMEPE